jgi:hypothetical protein
VSADAASVWAQGGVVAIRERQEAWLLDPNNDVNNLYAMMSDDNGNPIAYVGIPNNKRFIDQGGLPFLGYDAKGGIYGMPYQIPEYTVDEVNTTLNRMSPEELQAFRRQAIEAGLWDENVFPSAFGPTDEDRRIMSALMSQANWSKATSWEALLGEYVQNPNFRLEDAQFGSEGDTGYEGPITRREIVYSKTSVDAGRSYIRQLMYQMAGREPTDDEVRRYVAALNRLEAANPQITETVTEMGETERDEVSTQTTEGQMPVPQEVLRRQVEGDNEEEQFTYQAQGYFNRLLEVI